MRRQSAELSEAMRRLAIAASDRLYDRLADPEGQRPLLRASDADREAAVHLLQQHHVAGRLTATEFEERMADAYGAQTLGELDRLQHDLPPLHLPPPVVVAPRSRSGNRLLALHSLGFAGVVVGLAAEGTAGGSLELWPLVAGGWALGLGGHALVVLLRRGERRRPDRPRVRARW